MPSIMPDAPEGATTTTTDNPNAETIRGLREVADFLEAHPELPRAEYAAVVLGSEYSLKFPDARAFLALIGDALGDRAEEKVYGDSVWVGAEFESVRVYAAAKKRELTHTPPEPVYKPILARADR